jgi:hypothetical protein
MRAAGQGNPPCPVIFIRSYPMNAAEEQQMLTSLAEISKDMKALLTLTKDLAVEQEKVNEKSLQHLGNIAHKR